MSQNRTEGRIDTLPFQPQRVLREMAVAVTRTA